jgi:hypothetical protein
VQLFVAPRNIQGNAMAQREVITEDILQAAIAALDARIAAPVLPTEKHYSKREVFLKLRAKAKEALAAGHSLKTILDDLKGVGLGLTVSTARQYLKPGRKASSKKIARRPEPTENTSENPEARPAVKPVLKVPVTNGETKKGIFSPVEDDKNI